MYPSHEEKSCSLSFNTEYLTRVSSLSLQRMWGIDPHDQTNMGPAQFSTQRVEFCRLRKGLVKPSKIPEACNRKSLAEFGIQGLGKISDQVFPEVCPVLPVLFFVNNRGEGR